MRYSNFIAILVLFVCGLSLGTMAAHAQPYPNRPIQLISISPPGGGGDIMSRLLVEKLEKILGTQVVVLNKPGASDTLAADAVVRSKNDGYIIGYLSSAALVYSRITIPENLRYDPLKDLEPLGLHVFFPIAVAVRQNSPWKTFAALVDDAKRNPDSLRVSTPGLGSTANFNVELTQSLTGAKFNHIPFKGGEAVITALLGGHVELTYDAFGKFIPHIESGKMRVLLVAKKMTNYPDIPTLTELGYKQDLLSGWFGLFAPLGIPPEIKRVLVAAIEKGVKDPELKAKIGKLGYISEYKSPEEVRKLMVNDYETANGLAAKLRLRK
jgi:tripartite-type tricarboxylate transporter receptor subunit TctC